MNKEKLAEKILEAISQEVPTGQRHLVVLDRGWIFAGDVSNENEVLVIRNALNVRKWQQGGFGALSLGAKRAGAILDKSEDIYVSQSAVLFMVPIPDSWENE